MGRSAARSRTFMCVPTVTAAPSITGTAQSGQILTGANGAASNGTFLSRQWRRDGAAIVGATGATYTLQPTDIGGVITLAVTWRNGLNTGNTKVAVSAPTAAVTA
jgi:hypothetical protein